MNLKKIWRYWKVNNKKMIYCDRFNVQWLSFINNIYSHQIYWQLKFKSSNNFKIIQTPQS